MLRAIIVDDEALAIKRLQSMLSASGEVEVMGTFLDPLEAYGFAKANSVHVAFLDISMPDINGMRLSTLLFNLDAAIDIVFVTGYDEYAIQAFDLGALDYLMKPITDGRLAKTLEKVRKKHRSPAADAQVEATYPDQEILTEQEIRILKLIAAGLSNKEIAVQLTISAETVKSHIKNAYRKLDVNNRVRALQRAKELKVLL